MARVDQLIVTYFALIQPAEYWTHWDLNAQAIHRIGRDELAAGSPLGVVAGRLNTLAGGAVVYGGHRGIFPNSYAKRLRGIREDSTMTPWRAEGCHSRPA